jgi:hypothetical protein
VGVDERGAALAPEPGEVRCDQRCLRAAPVEDPAARATEQASSSRSPAAASAGRSPPPASRRRSSPRPNSAGAASLHFRLASSTYTLRPSRTRAAASSHHVVLGDGLSGASGARARGSDGHGRRNSDAHQRHEKAGPVLRQAGPDLHPEAGLAGAREEAAEEHDVDAQAHPAAQDGVDLRDQQVEGGGRQRERGQRSAHRAVDPRVRQSHEHREEQERGQL